MQQTASPLENLKEYWQNHTCKVDLESVYTLNAFTWKTNESNVILIQNRVKPKTYRFQRYTDYKNSVETHLDESEFAESGPYFNFMHQHFDGESIFTSVYKRFFGPGYSSTVFVSEDQSHVAIKHKLDGNRYDVFKGFDNEAFFGEDKQSKGHLMRDHNEYVATLKVSQRSSRITFSHDKQFCATYSSMGFQVFDLRQEPSINDDSGQHVLEPIFTYNVKSNVTYDKMLSVYLGNATDGDIFSNSWAMLQSRTFSMVHCVKFSTIHNNLDGRKAEDSIFFVDPEIKNTITVTIDSVNQPESFWQTTYAKFTRDGTQALVYTEYQVYKVDTSNDSGIKKRVEAIQNLAKKELLVFNHEEDEFTLVEKDNELRELSFYHTNIKTSTQLLDQTIDISHFDWKGFKLLEAIQLANQTCRLIGVRGAEEVFIWERVAGNKAIQLFEDMFPTRLSAMLMPYFAYSLGGNEVNIVPLFDENLILVQKLKMAEDEEIQKMTFSSLGNLFVVTRRPGSEEKLTNFFVYKIHVEEEIGFRIDDKSAPLATTEVKPVYDAKSEKKFFDDIPVVKRRNSQEMIIEPKIQRFGPIVLDVLADRTKVKETDIHECYVYDDEQGSQSRLAFIINAEHRLYFANFSYDSDKVGEEVKSNKPAKFVETASQTQQLRSLVKVNSHNYIFDYKGGAQVWNLFITDTKEKFIVNPIYQESNYELLAMQADDHRIYVLIQDRFKKKFLRVLTMKGKNQLSAQQTSFIPINQDNPDDVHFVDTFYTSNSIPDGVLIHDENMISKVYDDPIFPSIQHFKGFLPPAPPQNQDRVLMKSQITLSQQNRKLSMIMNYPDSMQSRKCFIIPYMSDNIVELTNPSTTQVTWITHREQQDTNTWGVGASMVTRIYQFNWKKWRLQEFNLCGICTRGLTFKEYKQNKILAINARSPQFLVTPPDSMFMKKVTLLEVTDLFTVEKLREWSTDTLWCEQEPGKAKINLYSQILSYQKRGATFQFAVNARKDVIIGIYQIQSNGEDQLIRMFLIPNDESRALSFCDIVLPQAPQEPEKPKLFAAFGAKLAKKQTLLQPLMEDFDEPLEVNQLAGAVGYELSDSKIIIWNEGQIFYANLTERGTNGKLVLQTSTFKLNAHEESGQVKESAGMHQFESSILEVSSRKEVLEQDPVLGGVGKPADIVNIRIKVCDDEVIMLSYDLENNKQISSLNGTSNAEFFYDSFDDCYVYDVDGIAKLDSGEMYNEYHLEKDAQEDRLLRVNPGMTWGQRMVFSGTGTTLLIDNKVILPYSQISYIQFCQEAQTTSHIDHLQFYTRDYYKIRGETTLHKYKYDPYTLEKVLDCYWRQDKKYILSVLVPSSTVTSVDNQQFQELKRQASIIGVAPTQGNATGRKIIVDDDEPQDPAEPQLLVQPQQPQPQQRKFGFGAIGNLLKGNKKMQQISQVAKQRKMVPKFGKKILDYIIEISHDKLLNQILYMLSQLPIEHSFTMITPSLKDLQGYVRFKDYLEKWFESHVQLEQVKVIYSDLGQGTFEYRSNLSILDASFFEKFKVKKPDPPTGSQSKDQPEADAADDGMQLLPVSLRVIRTSWFFEQQGKEFFTALLDSDDITLFSNPNLQAMITFQWNIFLPVYKARVFWPFMLGSYIPFSLISIDRHKDENGFPVIGEIQIVSLAVLGIYLIYCLFQELRELRQSSSVLEYVKDPANLFNFLALGIIIYAFIQTAVTYSRAPEERLIPLEHLRLVYVWGILIQNFVFLYYVKVFDFWATFVRSLAQIVITSLPLAATLFVFIFTQTLMFYVLAMNNPDDSTNFFLVAIDSYRFALGDFNITGTFEQTPNTIVFWLIFFIGTIVQILIILNMVIAVMSNSFAEVSATNEENIFKAKLQCLEDYGLLCDAACASKFKELDYLYLIEVDPVVTDIGPTLTAELPEQKVQNEILEANKRIQRINDEIYSLKNGQLQLGEKLIKRFNALSATMAGLHAQQTKQEVLTKVLLSKHGVQHDD